MTDPITAHRPFDMQRWLDSVDGRRILVTDWPADDQHRPAVLESRGAEPSLHPPQPKECEVCGETVMLVADSRAETGRCPICGTPHSPVGLSKP